MAVLHPYIIYTYTHADKRCCTAVSQPAEAIYLRFVGAYMKAGLICL